MKHFLLLFFAILSLQSFAQENKKVLLIGIDGCRPDALEVANTPTLDLLKGGGIFSPDALNDDITISGPGWSAILCGVWSDKHLVTGNDFSVNDYGTYPPVFKYAQDFDPQLHTASICHWDPINDFIIDDHADFKLNVSTDAAVSQQAVDYISVNDPDFMFLHFDDVDHAGHSAGFSPDVPAYIEAIEGVDQLIAPIITAIENRPDYDNEDWLILVTTDHGGLGFSHGGNSIQEQNVFVIASGKNIDEALILKDSIVLVDGPENCLGDFQELQFGPDPNFVQSPNGPIFDFGANQDFTVECRIRTTIPGDYAIIGNKDWDSGLNPGFIFSFKFPSGPEWKVNIGDGDNRVDINTGGEVADGEWHTLSASFDRDGLLKMYEDGVLIASEDISEIGNINTGEGIFIGADIDQGYPYNGAISEVRIWEEVVEEQTINDWHCSTIDDTHPNYFNLLGYWQLNEGDGTTIAIDYSLNNQNGTINGATWGSADTLVTYDYSLTPRLVDVPFTALTHLCVPIDESWELDGTSLIPECAITNATEKIIQDLIRLSPNPASDWVQINTTDLNSEPEINFRIFDFNGKLLQKGNDTLINIATLPSGIYLIDIRVNGQNIRTKLIKI